MLTLLSCGALLALMKGIKSTWRYELFDYFYLVEAYYSSSGKWMGYCFVSWSQGVRDWEFFLPDLIITPIRNAIAKAKGEA